MTRLLSLVLGCAVVIVVPVILVAASPAQLTRIAERRALATSSNKNVVPTLTCLKSEDWVTPNVNLQRVREIWFTWYNKAREENGLPPYSMEPALNRSAAIWSARSATKGVMNHMRDGTTAYYDYYAIKKWFKDLGLEFKNVKGLTFTESIGRGPYACKTKDCTESLLKAMRYTFDFYMAEKNKSYRPHYNAIMNSSFTMMGFGVAVKNGQYFLTAHFGTEIVGPPARLCGDAS